MTIADRRWTLLQNFNDKYIHDIDKAAYIANSYYRLCGLCETNLYRANDERLYNNRYTKELEEKEERWINRLNGVLAEYGLKLIFSGFAPQICVPDNEKSGNCSKETAFYWIAYDR